MLGENGAKLYIDIRRACNCFDVPWDFHLLSLFPTAFVRTIEINFVGTQAHGDKCILSYQNKVENNESNGKKVLQYRERHWLSKNIALTRVRRSWYACGKFNFAYIRDSKIVLSKERNICKFWIMNNLGRILVSNHKCLGPTSKPQSTETASYFLEVNISFLTYWITILFQNSDVRPGSPASSSASAQRTGSSAEGTLCSSRKCCCCCPSSTSWRDAHGCGCDWWQPWRGYSVASWRCQSHPGAAGVGEAHNESAFRQQFPFQSFTEAHSLTDERGLNWVFVV